MFELDTPPRAFGGAGAETAEFFALPVPAFAVFPTLPMFPAVAMPLTAGVGAVTLAATAGGTARAINCCSLDKEEVPLVTVVLVVTGPDGTGAALAVTSVSAKRVKYKRVRNRPKIK